MIGHKFIEVKVKLSFQLHIILIQTEVKIYI